MRVVRMYVYAQKKHKYIQVHIVQSMFIHFFMEHSESKLDGYIPLT